MKLKKVVHLYFKKLGKHTLEILKKIPGNLPKNLEKSWKYHGILLGRKSGNPAPFSAGLMVTVKDFLHVTLLPTASV